MSRFLLDTCTLIDWALDPKRLSESARLAIADGRSFVYVSAATAWEIAIKVKLGKLPSPPSLEALLKDNRFFELPISIAHAEVTKELPLLHRDPFDRLLIAQAKSERLVLITRDAMFSNYDVTTLAA